MERLTRRNHDGQAHATRVGYYDIIEKLAYYEELEEQLQSVYGECDGLLEKVVEGLVKHEGVEFEKPMKARLLTDEDVDKWDRLKGAEERILERLEEWKNTSQMEIEELAFKKALEIVNEEIG